MKTIDPSGQPTETLILGEHTYSIRVLHGNHGGWLFVRCGDMTIYEQPGYKDYDKALSDGELIARADHKEKLNPKPINPNSPWLKKADCTCGSGAHPRRCAKHPDEYDKHIAEINAAYAEEDITSQSENKEQ